MKGKSKTAKPADSKPLFMTLRREPFDLIRSGKKREEYRQVTNYWANRLEGRIYPTILFQNGYNADSPRLTLEYKGYTIKTLKGEKKPVYALKLGRIIDYRP